MKYIKIDGQKYIDPVQSIVESFVEMADKIINQYTFHMNDIDSKLLTACVSRKMVYENVDQVRIVLMNEAKLRVATVFAGRVSPKPFNNASVVIDYPMMVNNMLKGDRPEFHVVEVTIKDVDKILLIDHLIWDAFWNNQQNGDDLNDNGDIDLPDDYEPFDDGPDDDGGPFGDEPSCPDLPF